MSTVDADQKPAEHKRRSLIMYIWWMHHYPGKDWSKEERWLRMTVYAVAIFPMSGLLGVLDSVLKLAGVEFHWAAFLSFMPSWIGGLFVSRWLCGLLWPARVRKAEENAAKRYGDRPVNW
ncbi:MAG: hypothetical protein WB697_01935 [Stellaceae bacterium]